MNNILQIDKSKLREYGVSFTSYMFMLILMYYPNTKININLAQILEYGFIIENDVGYCLTNDGLAFIDEIEQSSINNTESMAIEELAEEMKLLFPEGKKVGTNKYWRDNKSNVVKKLKTFFKNYGHYDYGLILDATKKYVESFGNNNQLMRVLPYFILKDDSSDLLTTIENIDSVKSDSQNELWTSMLS
jgi:hypothetical protein